MRVKGGGLSSMEVMEERNQGRGTTSILLESRQRPSCCDNGVESFRLNRNHDRCQNMIVQSQNQNQLRNQNHHHSHPNHQPQPRHHHQYHFGSSGIGRNIEIDWREVDPYFSELSDCASFWTLINFTCDVIYSGLFVLFFIMGQDVESMFFEGLLNHINPILIYLILSLVFNYGALRSLRGGRERCFLVFSIMKGLLFPVTIMLLVYLVFFDVQEYFGTFWVSFVAIVSCYNGTAALGLWSMFTCNKYILVNEAAQKRMRKLAKQQRSTNYEADCRCGSSSAAIPPPTAPAQASASYCESNQVISSCSRTKPPNSASHSRRVGDSSCANNLILVCKPDVAASCTTTSCSKNSSMANNYHSANNQVFRGIGGGGGGGARCGPSKIPIAKDKRTNNSFHGAGYGGGSSSGRVGSSIVNIEDEDDDDYEDVLSFGDDDDDDEVLQISTVHKVMQEIRFLDSKRDRPDTSDDGDSL